MRTEERLHGHMKAAGPQVVMKPAEPGIVRRRVFVRRSMMLVSVAAIVVIAVVGGLALRPESVQPQGDGDPPLAHVAPTAQPSEALTPAATPTDEATPSTGGLGPQPSDDTAVPLWPPTEVGEALTCAYQYPGDLADMPVAFDGTVVGVHRGVYSEEAAGTPVEVELVVHSVFRGDLGETVTMHTWDFSGTEAEEPWNPTGIRVLAAASESLDIMYCGFTRPFSSSDADLWSAAFNS